jgi:hypothetical protein
MGVFFGSVFSMLAAWGLHCRGSASQHWLLAAALLACAISSGVWLLIAASIRDAAEQARHARIDAFIADPSNSAPAPVRGLESMPAWFDIWNWTNMVVFYLVTAALFLLVLHEAEIGPG